MENVDVIVVGAGMAGLTAAHELEERGIRTVVLDKGRAPGGRMATRRVGEARFDHGAQHFSARSQLFRERTSQWMSAGLAAEWFRSPSRTQPGGPVEVRHIGKSGMRTIPGQLAANLRVITATTVAELYQTGSSVEAVADDGTRWRASGLILTPPVPQTLQLLDSSGLQVAAGLTDTLSSIRYDACLVVMAQLDSPAGLPGGHLAPAAGPIAWMADNQHKGISGEPAVTVHSTPEFAAANLESPPQAWVAELVEAAAAHLAGSIVRTTSHRWRYSQPRRTLEIGAMDGRSTVPLVLAGEVFAGARVEGAFLSGVAAATTIENLL